MVAQGGRRWLGVGVSFSSLGIGQSLVAPIVAPGRGSPSAADPQFRGGFRSLTDWIGLDILSPQRLNFPLRGVGGITAGHSSPFITLWQRAKAAARPV